MHSIAIIPARGGSKRLPRKNILPLAGKPMLSWPVKTALASGLFDEVIVSTDNADIAAAARNAGAKVWDRKPELADDVSRVEDVCHDIISQMQKHDSMPDAFCAIYATAAFLNTGDLQASANRMMQDPLPQVLMGVSEYPIHPYKALHATDDSYLTAVYPQESKQKSQTYPHYVASNGTFYWARTDYFLDNPDFYAPKLVGHVVPQERAIDIDTYTDYVWAQQMAEVMLRDTVPAD